MAELPLDQAVPRFKANEDRLDTFVNSATGYTTSGGTSVQSIQQFLASIGSNGIDFIDNAKARFGTGNDLEIYHSGSGSFIRDTGTGDLTIDGSAISIQTASAERISVSASGIDVTGTVEFDGLSGTGAVTITDIADEDNMASNSATKLATQQSIKSYVDTQVATIPTGDITSVVAGTGLTGGGTTGDVTLNVIGGTGITANADNIAIDGTVATLTGTQTFTNKTLTSAVLNTTVSGTAVLDEDDMVSDSATKLATQQSIKAYVDANAGGGGLPTTGGTMTGDILFNDGVVAKYGTSSDLQIFHDGSDSYIKESGTGILFLRTNQLQIQSDDGLETYGVFTDNGSVQLYHNNIERLETTSTGIDVTGAIDVATSGASNTSKGLAIATSGTNFESDGGIISIDHAASGAVTGGYFSKYSAGGTLRHSVKGDGKGYFAGGIDVTGVTKTTGSGYNPANTGWATNASLITSGSYGGGLTFLDGSAGYSIRVENSGADLVIGQGATSGALTQKVKINSSGLDVTGELRTTDSIFLNSGTADSPQVVWSSSGYGDQYIDNYQGNLRVVNSGAQQVTIKQGGDVGIGTSAPTAKMHLFTDGIDQSVFSAQTDLGTNNRILTLKSPVSDSGSAPYRWQTSNSIQWEIDATETKSMLLNSAGNLGVGTYSPSYRIDVRGAANSDVAIQVKASGTGDVDAELRLDAADTGESLVRYARDGTTRAISEYTNSNEWNFTTYNQDVIDFQPNSTHVMRIKYNGNVGIGTTTCADKLHVEGNVYLGTSSRSVYTGGAGHLRLQTNTGEVKVLTANGATTNLITSGTGINIPADLQVGSTLEVGSLTPAQDGAIEVGVLAYNTPAIASTTDSTLLRSHIIFDNPNGVVGKINTIGSGTSYVTSSDYRLKTDVQAMTGSIDRLKALRPVNFEWIVDGTRIDGFLAHEAQEVVPEAVDGEKDAMRDQQYVESEATGDIYTPAVEATYETIQVELTPAVEATYDEDGNELTPAVDATYEEQQQELTPAVDEVIHSSDVVEPDTLEEGQLWRETTEKVMATRQVPDYQGIDQSKIVPLLTSALQDAIAKIEALETRLEALEA